MLSVQTFSCRIRDMNPWPGEKWYTHLEATYTHNPYLHVLCRSNGSMTSSSSFFVCCSSPASSPCIYFHVSPFAHSGFMWKGEIGIETAKTWWHSRVLKLWSNQWLLCGAWLSGACVTHSSAVSSRCVAPSCRVPRSHTAKEMGYIFVKRQASGVEGNSRDLEWEIREGLRGEGSKGRGQVLKMTVKWWEGRLKQSQGKERGHPFPVCASILQQWS